MNLLYRRRGPTPAGAGVGPLRRPSGGRLCDRLGDQAAEVLRDRLAAVARLGPELVELCLREPRRGEAGALTPLRAAAPALCLLVDCQRCSFGMGVGRRPHPATRSECARSTARGVVGAPCNRLRLTATRRARRKVRALWLTAGRVPPGRFSDRNGGGPASCTWRGLSGTPRSVRAPVAQWRERLLGTKGRFPVRVRAGALWTGVFLPFTRPKTSLTVATVPSGFHIEHGIATNGALSTPAGGRRRGPHPRVRVGAVVVPGGVSDARPGV